MAELPVAETLVAATGDAFKSSRLDQMLRNFSASYKLYWLKGVFDEAVEGSSCVTFEKLAARMIASAWYPVSYFRLNLGSSDMLTDAVLSVQNRCGLSADASAGDIIAAVQESSDAVVRAKVRNLYKYVPYRLIRPFYSDRLNEARNGMGRVPEAMVNGLIVSLNRDDAAGAPYRFSDDGDDVEVEAKACKAYLELKADLEAEGVHVDLDSARRSVADQQRIMKEFTEKYGADYA